MEVPVNIGSQNRAYPLSYQKACLLEAGSVVQAKSGTYLLVIGQIKGRNTLLGFFPSCPYLIPENSEYLDFRVIKGRASLCIDLGG